MKINLPTFSTVGGKRKLIRSRRQLPNNPRWVCIPWCLERWNNSLHLTWDGVWVWDRMGKLGGQNTHIYTGGPTEVDAVNLVTDVKSLFGTFLSHNKLHWNPTLTHKSVISNSSDHFLRRYEIILRQSHRSQMLRTPQTNSCPTVRKYWEHCFTRWWNVMWWSRLRTGSKWYQSCINLRALAAG